MYWEQKHPVINKDPDQEDLDLNPLINKDLGGENLDTHTHLCSFFVSLNVLLKFPGMETFPKGAKQDTYLVGFR